MEVSTTILCDDILNVCCMLDEAQRANWSFEQYLSNKGIPLVRSVNILKYLEVEGYIVHDPTKVAPAPYSITVKGEILRESGGFDGMKKREIEESKSRNEITKSVIGTNRISRITSIVSLIIALCALGISYFKSSPKIEIVWSGERPAIQQVMQGQQSDTTVHRQSETNVSSQHPKVQP